MLLLQLLGVVLVVEFAADGVGVVMVDVGASARLRWARACAVGSASRRAAAQAVRPMVAQSCQCPCRMRKIGRVQVSCKVRASAPVAAAWSTVGAGQVRPRLAEPHIPWTC